MTTGFAELWQICHEKYVNTKGVIRIHKSKKDRQDNGQKNKQRCTKHYTENERSSNTNPAKHRVWNQVLRKSKHFLLHKWHQSYCSSDQLQTWWEVMNEERTRKCLWQVERHLWNTWNQFRHLPFDFQGMMQGEYVAFIKHEARSCVFDTSFPYKCHTPFWGVVLLSGETKSYS